MKHISALSPRRWPVLRIRVYPPVGNLVGNYAEKLFDSLFILQVREYKTAVSHIIALSAVDDRLGIDAQRLSLSQCCIDSLVHDQRDGHV